MPLRFCVMLTVMFCAVSDAGRLLNSAEFPDFREQVIDPNCGKVCYAVTSTDVDGDGKMDIVAGGRYTHNIKLYLNLGTR